MSLLTNSLENRVILFSLLFGLLTICLGPCFSSMLKEPVTNKDFEKMANPLINPSFDTIIETEKDRTGEFELSLI